MDDINSFSLTLIRPCSPSTPLRVMLDGQASPATWSEIGGTNVAVMSLDSSGDEGMQGRLTEAPQISTSETIYE